MCLPPLCKTLRLPLHWLRKLIFVFTFLASSLQFHSCWPGSVRGRKTGWTLSVEAGSESTKSMKTTLLALALCFLGASFAHGQATSVLYAEPREYDVPSHPKQASRQPLATKQDLREGSDVVSDRGLRPLWEVAPKVVVVPLGDVARMLRKQHEMAPKADIIWEN